MKSQCIDTKTLADYVEGRLPEAEKARMEEHLSRCDECLEEFVLANALLGDSELTEYDPGPAEPVRKILEDIGESLKRKISEWVAALSPPAWHVGYASATVRSGRTSPESVSMLVKKDINALQTEMYFEKTDRDRAHISIKVFRDKDMAKNISLTLLRQGRLVGARQFVNTDDRAEFEDQPFGDYSLTVQSFSDARARKQAVPYTFEISDAGFHER